MIGHPKYDRIDFLVKTKDIPKIENLNEDIRFNVYCVTKDETIHTLYTSNKMLLVDNKRYILEDGITTLAYGHLVGRETAT